MVSFPQASPPTQRWYTANKTKFFGLYNRRFWTYKMKGKIDRINTTKRKVPIPVAARSKKWVCCLLLSGIVGSNPSETLMFVSFDFCVLSGRGLWVGLFILSEESYRVWCAWVWSWSFGIMRRACGPLGAVAPWEEGGGNKINWSYVIDMIYDIFINCNWVVTLWQYTFTLKQ